MKQALDLGHLRVAILPVRKCICRCYIFKGKCLVWRIGLKAMNSTQYPSTIWQGHHGQGTWMKRFFPYDVFGRLATLNIKMVEKERKRQPTAVPLDTLPERCTMTMHHEISARGSLMLVWKCSHLSSMWYVLKFEHAHGLKRYNDRRMTRGQKTCSLGGTASLGLLLPYFILTIFIDVFPKTIAPSMDCWHC